MKRRIYIVAIETLFLILAVGSCRKARTWLVKADNSASADVMVLLMGSFSERLSKKKRRSPSQERLQPNT